MLYVNSDEKMSSFILPPPRYKKEKYILIRTILKIKKNGTALNFSICFKIGSIHESWHNLFPMGSYTIKLFFFFLGPKLYINFIIFVLLLSTFKYNEILHWISLLCLGEKGKLVFQSCILIVQEIQCNWDEILRLKKVYFVPFFFLVNSIIFIYYWIKFRLYKKEIHWYLLFSTVNDK